MPKKMSAVALLAFAVVMVPRLTAHIQTEATS